MATQYLDKKHAGTTSSPTELTDTADNRAILKNRPDAAGLAHDRATDQIKYNGNDAVQTLVELDLAQTLTNKTLTSPVINGGTGTGSVVVAGGTITELTGDGAYSISVTLPPGAILMDFIITQKALWDSVTSATLIVGDTADPDGFFTAVDAKTTPAVGTSLRPDTVPGGTGDGAYLGDTNGEFVGPASSNFGRFYEAGSVITATITKVGAGTAGRTNFVVVYSVPTVVAQVVV
jgi:hypothetical protein